MEKKKKKEESCSIKLLTLSGGAEGPEGSLNNIALPVHDFFFLFPWRSRCESRYSEISLHEWRLTCRLFLRKIKKKKKRKRIKEWMRKWIWHLETHFHLFRRKEEVALHFYSSVGTDVNIKRGKHPHRHRLHSNKLYTGAPLPQYPQQPVFIVTIHMYTG